MLGLLRFVEDGLRTGCSAKSPKTELDEKNTDLPLVPSELTTAYADCGTQRSHVPDLGIKTKWLQRKNLLSVSPQLLIRKSWMLIFVSVRTSRGSMTLWLVSCPIYGLRLVGRTMSLVLLIAGFER